MEAFGLEGGVVRYEPNPRLDSLVPPELKARMQAAADSIAAGTLMPHRGRHYGSAGTARRRAQAAGRSR